MTQMVQMASHFFTLNYTHGRKAFKLARLSPGVGAVVSFIESLGEPGGMFGRMVGVIYGRMVGNVQENSREITGGTV